MVLALGPHMRLQSAEGLVGSEGSMSIVAPSQSWQPGFGF